MRLWWAGHLITGPGGRSNDSNDDRSRGKPDDPGSASEPAWALVPVEKFPKHIKLLVHSSRWLPKPPAYYQVRMDSPGDTPLFRSEEAWPCGFRLVLGWTVSCRPLALQRPQDCRTAAHFRSKRGHLPDLRSPRRSRRLDIVFYAILTVQDLNLTSWSPKPNMRV